MTTMPATAVGPELARSWLLVNAARPDRFAPAVTSAADVLRRRFPVRIIIGC